MPREDIKGNGIYSRYCQRVDRQRLHLSVFFFYFGKVVSEWESSWRVCIVFQARRIKQKNKSTNGTEQIVATISSVSQVSSPDSPFKRRSVCLCKHRGYVLPDDVPAPTPPYLEKVATTSEASSNCGNYTLSTTT